MGTENDPIRSAVHLPCPTTWTGASEALDVGTRRVANGTTEAYQFLNLHAPTPINLVNSSHHQTQTRVFQRFYRQSVNDFEYTHIYIYIYIYICVCVCVCVWLRRYLSIIADNFLVECYQPQMTQYFPLLKNMTNSSRATYDTDQE